MNDISVINDFLTKEETIPLFDFLANNINWHEELNVKDSDVKVKINRKMAYLTDKPVIYEYANFYFQGEIWNPILTNVKTKLEERLKVNFNSVLLNYYKDGKDEIKWHSDKEESLGENPVIACVNLGATRKFWFLKKDGGEKTFYEVCNGDLLVMGENCQKNYLHAILKEKDVTKPRISLTFRYNYVD